MKLAVRFVLVTVAISAIFYFHVLAVFFFGGVIVSRYAALEWPVMGIGLLSFIATTSSVIALIFRGRLK